MLKRIPISFLAFLGVVVLIAMIAAVTIFASAIIGRTVLDQFQSQQLQVSTALAQQTEAYFSQLGIETLRLTQLDEIKAVASSRFDLAKTAIQNDINANDRNSVVVSVTRFSFRGEPRYAWPTRVDNQINEGVFPYSLPEDLVAQTEAGGVVNVETGLYQIDNRYLLIVPFTATTNNIEFLAYELDIEAIFNDVLASAINDLSSSGQLWVFDYQGELVFQARAEPQVDVDNSLFNPITLAGLTETVSERYATDGNNERIAAFAPTELFNQQFAMVLSRSTDDAQEVVADDLQIIFGIAVAAVALIAVLALIALRRIVSETSRRRSEASMRRATRSLLEVSRALNSSLELQTVLNRILVELQKIIPYYSSSILLLNDRGELEVASHRGEDTAAHSVGVFKAEEARAAREVIARSQPVIINDTSKDERWSSTSGSEIRSWIGLPLRVFEQSVGVLNINSSLKAGFSPEDIELAEAFSDQASVALQNARLHDQEVTRIEQELTVARGIQTSLLPSVPPDIPELKVAFNSLAARQVSGDFFQLIPLTDGQWGIFVGDVSGKGMPAALIMAVMTTALRDEVIRQRDPGKLLGRLNERLLDRFLQVQMNSALLAAVFDPATYQLSIANAGMVQPYWRAETDDEWDFVDIGGYPLGASQNVNYTSKVLKLRAGALMVLFSDGIIEAENWRGEFFGFERLEYLLNEMPTDISAEEALNRILNAVQQHIGERDPADDMTVMVLRTVGVERPTEPEPEIEDLPSIVDMVRSRRTERPVSVKTTEEFLMPRENVELFLPSILGFEKVARSAAEAIARKMGFSDDRIDDLKTAVAEACMNAIEHGNLEDKATSVTVLLSSSSDHLEVRVVDRGRQQIPDPLPPPGNSDSARGWGLFFIQSLMDEVEIVRSPEGNVVRMTIFLGKDQDDLGEPSSDEAEWVDKVD